MKYLSDCIKRKTTQNGQNKWTKILSHETTIFGLKMMVESGL